MDIGQAEKQIARILASLEIAQDALVTGVSLVDLEITTYESTRPVFDRRVRIELERRPGHQWGQADA